MLATPAVLMSAIVTILSIGVCFYMVFLVGNARHRHGVAAPAMSGHPVFERAMRVQMNTMEQFVVFLPALWLATLYFHMVGYLPAALGLLWCVGRLVYAGAYMADPHKRAAGFGITVMATFLLLAAAAIGIVQAWLVV